MAIFLIILLFLAIINSVLFILNHNQVQGVDQNENQKLNTALSEIYRKRFTSSKKKK
ncbi:hypothetical protein [Kriegella aquimaris]|uniref:Uncharacterized protein n=1 Tax=Kriegella aquimaris TaxID=192904 RepID=A0A1G9XJF2_9FLAO|nr:hypothetical protein [Kriegella aquimaris]SDM96651.1 hypothetical protein SAMN04488514_11833 [Kriegella aquimaris]